MHPAGWMKGIVGNGEQRSRAIGASVTAILNVG